MICERCKKEIEEKDAREEHLNKFYHDFSTTVYGQQSFWKAVWDWFDNNPVPPKEGK